MKKRNILIIFVAAMIIFSCDIFICNAETVASGDCGASGNNVIWSLDDVGTLTISGNGKMKNYSYTSTKGKYWNFPKEGERSLFAEDLSIKEVIIEKGVISFGDSLFPGCSKMISKVI